MDVTAYGVDLFRHGLDIVLHLDLYLGGIISRYGFWTYLLLFAVIFIETGLVIWPFLPGDSILFAAGTFAALGSLDLAWLFILLSVAAVGGDTVNYWAGCVVGPKVFASTRSRFLNRDHLNKTHQFYEKYGGKTIIIARFMPIVRTFAPFVAGIGSMTYLRFLAYNVVGGVAWIVILTLGGYFFGNIPLVKKNFSLVIMAIIVLSVLPAVVTWLSETVKQRKTKRPARPGMDG